MTMAAGKWQPAVVSGLLCVLGWVGRRSWMWTWGAVGVMAVMYDGIVSTLGDGASSEQLSWRVDGGFVECFATWRVRGHACGILGLLLSGRLGGGRCGLQLLAATVSSSLPSSEARIGMGCCCVCGAGGLMAFVG